MLESEFLIYDRRADRRHVQNALAFAFVLAAASLALFPYRLIPVPKLFVFIPIIDTMHLLFCGIIAAVLLSLASILRSRALIALGSGYVFVGLIAVAHGLTFPNAVSPTGLLGARPDTGTWLYLAWHTVLPASIIAYALLRQSPLESEMLTGAPPRDIPLFLALAVTGAVAMTWLATAGIPPSFSEEVKTKYAGFWHYLVIVVSIAPIPLLWRGRRSILDLCLMLTLWAWFLEYVLIFPGAARFCIGWYAGRLLGLLSGLFVLLMLLVEMSRLYARTVLLAVANKRERENRLMLGEAIGAFIAHELRQPLAAISLNAYTGRKLCAQGSGELSALMDDLMQDSLRANKFIESTRAIFKKTVEQRCPTDINQLIRDTLLLTSRELRSRDVTVEVRLEELLPLVDVNPMQMQQVLMNLFVNAAEAMSEVAGRPRTLTVHSSRRDLGLTIRVEDTGPSVKAGDREKIFAPFFTTKKHGTGMGLSICRSVINAHGGSIQIAPLRPFGACFEIFLPHRGPVGFAPR